MDLTTFTENPVLFSAAVIASTFVLEDPTTVGVSALIASGKIGFWEGFLPLLLGIFLGDLGLYFLGAAIRKGIRKARLVPIDPGVPTIVLARFVPGMRTITFTSAGVKAFPLGKFFLLAFPSTIVWTLLLLKATESVLEVINFFPVWVNVLIGIGVFCLLQILERRVRRYLTRSAGEA